MANKEVISMKDLEDIVGLGAVITLSRGVSREDEDMYFASCYIPSWWNKEPGIEINDSQSDLVTLLGNIRTNFLEKCIERNLSVMGIKELNLSNLKLNLSRAQKLLKATISS